MIPARDELSLLFERALAVRPEERGEWLENACGRDASLRDELTSLLAAYESSDGYFEELAEQVVAPALRAVADVTQPEIATGRTVAHYRILERLGGGGMGDVYKVRDLTLDRIVALKFLPPDLCADGEAKRWFVTEARAASALDHPAVAVVHEIGETDEGQLYIAMAYYEGETLAERLARGPIPASESLSILRQIVSGLAAAHGQGIVHRDIKPSNILLTNDGAAKLLDFGIAKVMASQMSVAPETSGTVGYMSPEQTHGGEIDGRSDLWSLGVVFYEMLAGVRPFLAETEVALIHAIRHEDPRPLGTERPKLPGALLRVVDRCLTKDPVERYLEAGDLLADLQALGPHPAVPRRARRRRAALGAGAAAGLLVPLAILLWPRSQTPTADTEAYTHYLRGRYLLENSDAASFETARDEFQLALDRDPTFALAASGLADAYDHLAGGAALPADDAYPRARALAERALSLDPELAEAHASLAKTLSAYYWDSEAAERHFLRAIELDSGYPRAHFQYAAQLRNLGRFDEALTEARTAQQLDPLAAHGHIEEVITLYVSRRYDEAIAKVQRLLRAVPSAAYADIFIGLARAQQGRYEEALAALDRMDPEGRHPDAQSIRGYVYARAGRPNDARRTLATLDSLLSPEPVSAFHKAVVHVGLGEHDRALDLLEQAAAERTWRVRLLGVEPIFDPLRSEPRFQALLEQAGLGG